MQITIDSLPHLGTVTIPDGLNDEQIQEYIRDTYSDVLPDELKTSTFPNQMALPDISDIDLSNLPDMSNLAPPISTDPFMGIVPLSPSDYKPARGLQSIPKTDEGTALGRGLSSGISGFTTAIGTTFKLGLPGLVEEATGLDTVNRQDVARRYQQMQADAQVDKATVTWDDVSETFGKKGIIDGLDKLLTYTGEQIGRSLPYMGPTIAGAVTGSVILPIPILGTILGGTLGGAATFFGMNLERQIAEKSKATGKPPEPEELGFAGSAITAIPQAALDTALYLAFGPAARSLGVLGKSPTAFARQRAIAKDMGTKTAEELAAGRVALGKMLAKEIPKGMAIGTLVEAPTETMQQALERLQAGLPVDPANADAFAEYLESGIAGGLLGAVFGAGGGSFRGLSKRQRLQGIMRPYSEKVKALRAKGISFDDINQSMVREVDEEGKATSPGGWLGLARLYNKEVRATLRDRPTSDIIVGGTVPSDTTDTIDDDDAVEVKKEGIDVKEELREGEIAAYKEVVKTALSDDQNPIDALVGVGFGLDQNTNKLNIEELNKIIGSVRGHNLSDEEIADAKERIEEGRPPRPPERTEEEVPPLKEGEAFEPLLQERGAVYQTAEQEARQKAEDERRTIKTAEEVSQRREVTGDIIRPFVGTEEYVSSRKEKIDRGEEEPEYYNPRHDPEAVPHLKLSLKQLKFPERWLPRAQQTSVLKQQEEQRKKQSAAEWNKIVSEMTPEEWKNSSQALERINKTLRRRRLIEEMRSPSYMLGPERVWRKGEEVYAVDPTATFATSFGTVDPETLIREEPDPPMALRRNVQLQRQMRTLRGAFSDTAYKEYLRKREEDRENSPELDADKQKLLLARIKNENEKKKYKLTKDEQQSFTTLRNKLENKIDLSNAETATLKRLTNKIDNYIKAEKDWLEVRADNKVAIKIDKALNILEEKRIQERLEKTDLEKKRIKQRVVVDADAAGPKTSASRIDLELFETAGTAIDHSYTDEKGEVQSINITPSVALNLREKYLKDKKNIKDSDYTLERVKEEIDKFLKPLTTKDGKIKGGRQIQLTEEFKNIPNVAIKTIEKIANYKPQVNRLDFIREKVLETTNPEMNGAMLDFLTTTDLKGRPKFGWMDISKKIIFGVGPNNIPFISFTLKNQKTKPKPMPLTSEGDIDIDLAEKQKANNEHLEIVPATEAYITAKDIESSGSEADWIAKTNPLFLPEPWTYNLDGTVRLFGVLPAETEGVGKERHAAVMKLATSRIGNRFNQRRAFLDFSEEVFSRGSISKPEEEKARDLIEELGISLVGTKPEMIEDITVIEEPEFKGILLQKKITLSTLKEIFDEVFPELTALEMENARKAQLEGESLDETVYRIRMAKKKEDKERTKRTNKDYKDAAAREQLRLQDTFREPFVQAQTINVLENELEKLKYNYQQNQSAMSDTQLQAKSSEIEDLEKRIEDYREKVGIKEVVEEEEKAAVERAPKSEWKVESDTKDKLKEALVETDTDPESSPLKAAILNKNMADRVVGEEILLTNQERQNILNWIADKLGSSVEVIFLAQKQLQEKWKDMGGAESLTDRVMAFTDPVSRIIVLSSDRNLLGDTIHAAGEEVFHMFEALAMTAKERKLFASVLNRKLAEENNIDLSSYSKAQQNEEARAKLVARYFSGIPIKGLTTPVKRLLYKMKMFLNRLHKFITGKDWKLSPEEQVIKNLEQLNNGELAARVGASPSLEQASVTASTGLWGAVKGSHLLTASKNSLNDLVNAQDITNTGKRLSLWNRWITHLSGMSAKYPLFGTFYNHLEEEIALRNRFKNKSSTNLQDFLDATQAMLPWGKKNAEAKRILKDVSTFITLADFLNLRRDEIIDYTIELEPSPIPDEKRIKLVTGTDQVVPTDAYMLDKMGLTGQKSFSLTDEASQKAFDAVYKTFRDSYQDYQRSFLKMLSDTGFSFIDDVAKGGERTVFDTLEARRKFIRMPSIDYKDLNTNISGLYPRLLDYVKDYLVINEDTDVVVPFNGIKEYYEKANKRYPPGMGIDEPDAKEIAEKSTEYLHDKLERASKSPAFGGTSTTPAVLYKKLSQLYSSFSTLKDIEHNIYVPHFRLGQKAVHVAQKKYDNKTGKIKTRTYQNAEGKTITENVMETVMVRPIPPTRWKSVGLANADIKATERTAREIADQARREFPEKDGYDIKIIDFNKESLFGDAKGKEQERLSLRRALPLIDKALMALGGYAADPNDTETLMKDPRKGQYIMDLMEEIHQKAGQRAFERFTTERRDPPIVGYFNEDNNDGSYLSTALERYINSSANISSSLWQQAAINDTFKVLQERQPGLYQYALDSWLYFNTFRAQDEALRAFAFHAFLGFNLSSSALNLLQIPQSSFPILGSIMGATKSAASLSKAFLDSSRMLKVFGKQAASLGDYGFNFRGKKPSHVTPDEWNMLKTMHDIGQIQPIQNLDLAGEYFGDTGGLQRYGFSRRILFASAWAFGLTENINRVATSLSAYRMAKSSLKNDKTKRRIKLFARHTRFAPYFKMIEDRQRLNGLLISEEGLPTYLKGLKKDEQFTLLTSHMMIEKTQFMMGKQNRPGLFRNFLGQPTIAGLATQFQSYPFQMMENWSGAFQRALTGRFGFEDDAGTPTELTREERLMALKQGILMTSGFVAFAGLVGLPFADDTNELLKIMTRNLGDNIEFDAIKYSRNEMNKIFGAEFTEGIMYGPLTRSALNLVGFPIDLSRRGGMGSLIPFMRAFTGTPSPQVMVGPAGTRIFDWAQDLVRTMNDPAMSVPIKTYALLSFAFPVALSKIFRTFSEIPTRGFTTKSGMTLIPPDEISWQQIVSHMIGFTPGELAKEYEKRGIKNYANLRTRPGARIRANAIARLMTDSIENDDPDKWSRAMELYSEAIDHDTNAISRGDLTSVYAISFGRIIDLVMMNLSEEKRILQRTRKIVRPALMEQLNPI